MKKTVIITTILTGMLTYSCSKRDQFAELEKLKTQRDQLNQRIQQIQKTMNGNGEVRTGGKRVYVDVQHMDFDTFKHFIKVQGTVTSDNNILLPAQSSGVVKKIHVEQGDRIKEGQLLAELDGSILEQNIAELKNSLDLARTLYERQARLWEKKIGSEVDYLQSKNSKESLEKNLDAIREQYRLTKISSPIQGTVDEIFIKEGEAAAMGLGAIRIVQLSDLKIEADLSEWHIQGVKKGDPVDVKIPVLGRQFSVDVVAVSRVIDPDSRTFGIEIDIPGSQTGLMPNMLTVLTINDYTNPKAMIVPRKVIQKQGEQEYLFVAQSRDGDLKAEKRFVKTGLTNNGQIEITDGLKSGEIVVVFGYEKLSNGQLLALADNPAKNL